MRQQYFRAILTVLWLVASATTAGAQMLPRHHSHSSGYYDGWGGYSGGLDALPSTLEMASMRRVAQSGQLVGDAVAARQIANRQSNINSALAADAAQRQGFINQQENSRDWWFQSQQQSMAQQRAMAAQAGANAAQARAVVAQAEAMGVSAGYVPPSPAPTAKTDVIPWLSLLCDPQFAEQRSRIEAPYRRGDKGLSQPTPDDYRDMIAATDQMKTLLKGMAASVSAQDYLNAEAFLNQLAKEARERLEKKPAERK
jgi:hypothetical protein